MPTCRRASRSAMTRPRWQGRLPRGTTRSGAATAAAVATGAAAGTGSAFANGGHDSDIFEPLDGLSIPLAELGELPSWFQKERYPSQPQSSLPLLDQLTELGLSTAREPRGGSTRLDPASEHALGLHRQRLRIELLVRPVAELERRVTGDRQHLVRRVLHLDEAPVIAEEELEPPTLVRADALVERLDDLRMVDA